MFLVVHAVRRRVDELVLSLQHRPGLHRTMKVFRAPMAWVVRKFLPAAFDRQELIQARTIMGDAPSQPIGGASILFMSFRAWAEHVAWDVTMAQGLRHRGATCEFFYSGGGLPICEIGWAATDIVSPCDACGGYVASMIDAAGFPKSSVGDLVGPEERDAILADVRASSDPQVRAEAIAGFPLDPVIEPSLVWYFRSATLPKSETVKRARIDYLAGASLMATAARRLFERRRPDVIVMVNGRFYEEEIVRKIASSQGIRVASYEVGAQKGTLFFSHHTDVPASDYSIDDLWSNEGGADLTPEEEDELASVLRGRSSGASAHRAYYRKLRSLERDESRSRIVLFTNVTWDTAVIGKHRAFETMFDWVREAIEWAVDHPGTELIIRVHPAESRWPGLESAERVSDWAAAEFGPLPRNVQIIGPEESVDSYRLMDEADLVLVYSSTIGLEAAARGKAVLVAGDTHYRGRGFTIDIDERGQLREELESFREKGSSAPAPALARRYAYLFFCRAMVPFPAVSQRGAGRPVFEFSNVSELAPGRDPFLDLICEALLTGSPLWLGPNSAS